MRVEPLIPDASPLRETPPAAQTPNLFGDLVDAVGGALDAAESAEDAFATGHGSLQAAMIERARAGVALSVATAAASRAVSAMQSIFNLQV
jgi:flagellar hook-basal body complex protein FliE